MRIYQCLVGQLQHLSESPGIHHMGITQRIGLVQRLAVVQDQFISVLEQATGRDLNLVVGQKLNATIGGDLQERIEGLRQSVVGQSQRLQAPKAWLGSEGVNVLQVLCDLLDLVQEMNLQLAEHVHGPTPPPSNAAAFT